MANKEQYNPCPQFKDIEIHRVTDKPPQCCPLDLFGVILWFLVTVTCAQYCYMIDWVVLFKDTKSVVMRVMFHFRQNYSETCLETTVIVNAQVIRTQVPAVQV